MIARLLLVSLAPAAGSTLSGEGGLINIDLEAINAVDSGLVFDVANVHLVAADGRSGTLALRPASLTVKPPEAPAPKSNPDQTSAPAAKPDTPDDQILTSALGINLSTGFGTPGSAVTTKSYVVQKHDNLWSIAKEHGVSYADLRKINPSLRSSILTIGADFFSTMQVPILSGRAIDARDRSGSPMVAVVSEAFAKRSFGDRSPLGEHLGMGQECAQCIEIVGVAANTLYGNLKKPSPPTIYLPFGVPCKGCTTSCALLGTRSTM